MADGGLQGTMWLTAAALAGMPGMPGTERGVNKAAERGSWERRARAKGKGWEYRSTSLPEGTQLAIEHQRAVAAANARKSSPEFQAGKVAARRLVIAESVDSAVQKRTKEQSAAAAAGLTGNDRARMDARLEILTMLGAYALQRGTGICNAIESFCAAYANGELAIPANVRQILDDSVRPRSVHRWRSALKKQGPTALAGNYGNRANSGAIESNEAVRDFAIGLVTEKPHISAKLLHVAIEARFKTAPDVRSVQRFIAKLKSEQGEVLLATANPDAWKNKHMVGFGSLSESVTRACQLWMLDSTPADLQLEDGRYNLVGVIDIGWRGFSLHVTKTSTADSVCQVMRRGILEWGVPEAIKVDNGQDYASNKVANLVTALGIDARFSAPFSPWEKGNIERAFRSFSHNLLELLPGYSGHNVAEAQELRGRASFADRLFKKNEVIELKLTAAQLQDFCDRWCRDYYMHEAHAGLGGATPFQRFAQLRDVVRRVDDVRALDMLLGEGDLRMVSKKGIRIDGLTYIAPELGTVVRQEVLVRREESDIGRVVVYHNERFLCIAECPEVAGVSRREIAIEAKARQTAAISEKKRELKALGRKAKVRDIAFEILDHKRDLNASLSTLPAPNVIHMMPALEAAADAADALDAARAPGPAAEVVSLEDLRNLGNVMRAEQVQDETAEDRFRRACTVLMKPEAERDDIERRFLKNHLHSAEFNGRWSVFESFGTSAFNLPDSFAALLPDGAAYQNLLRAQQGE